MAGISDTGRGAGGEWYALFLHCFGRDGKSWNASEVLGRLGGGTKAHGSRKTGLEPKRHGPRGDATGDELSRLAFLPRLHLSTSHLSAGRSDIKSLQAGLRVLPARGRLDAVRHVSAE